MKNKEYVKDKILDLHYAGLSNKEIAEKLNTKKQNVAVLVSRYAKPQIEKDYFNVNDFECWVSPAVR